MTLDDAKAVLAALISEGVELVVIGSMAMAAQGLPRATQDLDFFVSPDIQNIEALKRALFSLYEDPQVEEIDPYELAGEYPAVEYVPPHGRFSIDILTRLGEAFSWQDLLENSDEIHLGEMAVRVASARMLYRMKRDTVRPQDHADAARIREAFDFED
ncbi:MAG: nucleotidyl transferase AbiEii/AbiGii toxin family protein [Acidobacteriota bacterium]